MLQPTISRRKLIHFLGATAGIAMLPSSLKSAPAQAPNKYFSYCLNTATIREHHLGLVKELEIISRAGYTGVELWMDTLQTYLEKGGTTSELKRILKDLNLTAENAIGFAAWIVDDENERKNGIEQLKKEMNLLAEIGCKRTAAPPAGAIENPGLNLRKAGERYRAILEMGEQLGVIPHLELWGFSANLNKLSDVMYVAIESGHPKARVLLDNYHLYKGDSSLDSLQLINPLCTEIFHMNDYIDIPRATITDADRILPGDGISPLKNVLKTFKHPSRKMVLSVEIFNKEYYQQDPLKVAKLALKKMQDLTAGI